MYILKLMSSQGNIKDHVFKKQTWRPLIFMCYFDFLSLDDSVCKKLEKINHKFNYTHTSLKYNVTWNISLLTIQKCVSQKYNFRLFTWSGGYYLIDIEKKNHRV